MIRLWTILKAAGLVAVLINSANADGAVYVGAGAFNTCSQFLDLSADDPTMPEFQDWTYGYWSARNHVNSFTEGPVKNVAHASVLGEEFFRRMRMQCTDQPSLIMFEIVQQVYGGLPTYKK